jgi:hypothetical protein
MWYSASGFEGSLERGSPVAQEKTVILSIFTFIAKTWFLWWMLAILIVLRWFHLVASARPTVEGLDAMAPEEEEQAYILSWRILRKTRGISLFKTERAR